MNKLNEYNLIPIVIELESGNYYVMIDSGNVFGTMNGISMTPENMTEEDKKYAENKGFTINKDLQKGIRNEIAQIHRNNICDELYLGHNYVVMADQPKPKNGTGYMPTKKELDSVIWDERNIPHDFLITSMEDPGILAVHPVADCPVITMVDKKKEVALTGHCSAEKINQKLPKQMADYLVNQLHSNTNDISVLVSTCIGPSWTYNRKPPFYEDYSSWGDAITTDDEKNYKIDLKKAIIHQLKDYNLDIRFSYYDTARSKYHYSNSIGRNGHPERNGRFLAGGYFATDEELNKLVEDGLVDEIRIVRRK